MLVILLFAAAGALAGAGAGGAWYAAEQAKREAAARLSHRDREALRQALEDEIAMADLLAQARAVGVDPQMVASGYEALRDGRMTLEQVLDQILVR